MPADVELNFEQLTLHDGNLNDVGGKLDLIVERAGQLSKEYGWDGLIFPGAPREVLNPELFPRLSLALNIPVATALRSSAAALRALSAKRALLLTPFDEMLNGLIKQFLENLGIATVSPLKTLRHYTDALSLSPADVAALTQNAFRQQDVVDAIYFQGAVLDPLEVMETLENELKVPIVASNAAMVWFMLSRLGLNNRIVGYGKLLSSWPMLPDGEG